MLNIVKVQPVSGKAIVYAVVSTDETYKDLNQYLMEFIKNEFGIEAYFSYIESFAVADVDISGFGVSRFLNMDDYNENLR